MRETQLPAQGSAGKEELFGDLETYCMFIGYSRSGHSLIGFLLDAHPNMIIAHELHVLKYIDAGFNEGQIYHLLLERSQAKADRWQAKAKVGGGPHRFSVPHQWQGRFHTLRVIGDKQGGGSTRYLSRYPDLLQRLRETINLKIKFIHVVRNPYDNIKTMAARKNLGLEDSTNQYFFLCETIAEIKKQIAPGDLFEMRHESFIDNPQVILRELCHFLGQDALDDYLKDCASIVYKSPHRSRHDTQWDHTLIDIVRERMDEFAFLKGYSFET